MSNHECNSWFRISISRITADWLWFLWLLYNIELPNKVNLLLSTIDLHYSFNCSRIFSCN